MTDRDASTTIAGYPLAEAMQILADHRTQEIEIERHRQAVRLKEELFPRGEEPAFPRREDPVEGSWRRPTVRDEAVQGVTLGDDGRIWIDHRPSLMKGEIEALRERNRQLEERNGNQAETIAKSIQTEHRHAGRITELERALAEGQEAERLMRIELERALSSAQDVERVLRRELEECRSLNGSDQQAKRITELELALIDAQEDQRIVRDPADREKIVDLQTQVSALGRELEGYREGNASSAFRPMEELLLEASEHPDLAGRADKETMILVLKALYQAL